MRDDTARMVPGRVVQSVARESDSGARGPGIDTRSDHSLSFRLPLIQDEQLSVTGEKLCTKH